MSSKTGSSKLKTPPVDGRHQLLGITHFALGERNIVLREYDYRIAERPLYSVFRDMDRALYGDGALARSVIGEPEVIANYSLDAAASLHKQSHALSDATVLIYGDVSEARLEAAVASLSVERVHTLPSNAPAIRLVADGVVRDRIVVSLAKLHDFLDFSRN